jgi:hypothetical protein
VVLGVGVEVLYLLSRIAKIIARKSSKSSDMVVFATKVWYITRSQ